MDAFSRNIAALRKARNLTQTQLAEALYVSHQAVSKWEKGKSVPDAEMLTAIARYFRVTVDQLLGGEIRPDAPPACTPGVRPVPAGEGTSFAQMPAGGIYNQPASQEELPAEESVPRRKNPLGVLFLIPMLLLLAAVVLWPVVRTGWRSLTAYNVLEAPEFIGLGNYTRLLFEDDVFAVALGNTAVLVPVVTLIVGTLAYAAARLLRPAPRVVRYGLLLLFDLLSIFTLASGYTNLFSADAYGVLNSFLLSQNLITEPISFTAEYGWPLQLLLLCLSLFGPLLTVLCLLKPRRVADGGWRRTLLPLEGSLQVYAAAGLPVLMLPFCRKMIWQQFGYPSANYALHTLTDHYLDYSAFRFEMGYAAAIAVVMLLLLVAFLAVCFAVSLGGMHLAAMLKRYLSKPSGAVRAALAYTAAGLLLYGALVCLVPLGISLLDSFKDTSEWFRFPRSLFPQEPTLDNYKFLFFDNFWDYGFIGRLFSMVVSPLLPAVAVTLISVVSAFGVSAFEYKVRPFFCLGIALCLVLLPSAGLVYYETAARMKIIDTWLTAFYAAFSSAALWIGFFYIKAVIEKALVLGHRSIPAAVLGGIPVLLITYVLCFIHPFVDMLLYSVPSFTVYFNIGREPFQTAWRLIVVSVAFGFLLLATVTAVLFFPRTWKKRKRLRTAQNGSLQGTAQNITRNG